MVDEEGLWKEAKDIGVMNHDGLGKFQNKFCVEGNLKYKYNNSFIALSDPIATARNERKNLLLLIIA